MVLAEGLGFGMSWLLSTVQRSTPPPSSSNKAHNPESIAKAQTSTRRNDSAANVDPTVAIVG